MKIIGFKVNSGKQKKTVTNASSSYSLVLKYKMNFNYVLTFVADQLDPNCSKLKQIYTFFLLIK